MRLTPDFPWLGRRRAIGLSPYQADDNGSLAACYAINRSAHMCFYVLYVCIPVCVHICIYVYICIHVYIYIYMHTHMSVSENRVMSLLTSLLELPLCKLLGGSHKYHGNAL